MQLILDEEAKNSLKDLKEKIKSYGRKLKSTYDIVGSSAFTDVFVAEPDVDQRMKKLNRALKSFKYHLSLALNQIEYYSQGQKKVDGEDRLDKLKRIIDNWKQESKQGCPSNKSQLEQKFKEDNMFVKNQLEEMVRQTYVEVNSLKETDATYYGGKNADKCNAILEKLTPLVQNIKGTAILDTTVSLEQAQNIKAQLTALRKHAVTDLSQENVDALFRNINMSIAKIKTDGNKGKALSERDKKELTVFTDEDMLTSALFVKESIAKNKKYFMDLTRRVAQDVRENAKSSSLKNDEEYLALQEYLDELTDQAVELQNDPDATQSDIDYLQGEFARTQERIEEIKQTRILNRFDEAQLRAQENTILTFLRDKIAPVLNVLERQCRYGVYNKIKSVMLEYRIDDMQELTQQFMAAVMGSVIGDDAGQVKSGKNKKGEEHKTPEDIQMEIVARIDMVSNAVMEKLGASNQPIKDMVKQRTPEMPKIEQKAKAPVVDKSGLADILKRKEAKQAAEQKAQAAQTEAEKVSDPAVTTVNVSDSKADEISNMFKTYED